MRLRSVYVFCGFLLLASIQVHAQSITIQNSGFELPVLGDSASAGVNAPLLIGSNSSPVSNWTLTASSLLSVSLSVPARAEIINPTGSGPVNISGSQIGLLRANGLAGVATTGSAYQDLGVSYTANSRYTLSVDVGVESLASLLSGYGFSLMNGSNTLATRDQSTLLALFLNSNQLYHASLTFDTNGTVPTGNVGVQFFESSLANVAGAFIFDNVSLTVAAIPEPATIGLIGLSIVGAAGAYYRHRCHVKRQMEASV
ncbi:MAG: PEP-CTERM sorting domain-containing protein [Gemmatales bacterium]